VFKILPTFSEVSVKNHLAVDTSYWLLKFFITIYAASDSGGMEINMKLVFGL
jgi:hypothetical protein